MRCRKKRSLTSRKASRSPSSFPYTTRRTTSSRCTGLLVDALDRSRRSLRDHRRRRRKSRRDVLAARAPCRRTTRLKLVRFRRNFGQTAAMAAGFDHASGEVIVPMDGDLQNDPADIAPPAREDRRGLRRRQRLAARPEGRIRPPAAVADRELADRPRHRRAPARLRLHAEGIPRRDRPGDAALRRDAPLPAGARVPGRARGSPRCRSRTIRASPAEASTAWAERSRCCSTC